jgi:gluconate 2-dehydrogenase alpha chain
MVTVLKETDAVVIGMGWTGSIPLPRADQSRIESRGLGARLDAHAARGFHDSANRDELKYGNRHELFQDTAMDTVSLRHTTRDTHCRSGVWVHFCRATNVGGRRFALEWRDLAAA